MIKKLFTIIVLSCLFLLTSACSSDVETGDVIVLPDYNPGISSMQHSNTQNSGLSSNMNNNLNSNLASNNGLGNVYFSPPAKVLNFLPQGKKWLDFEVVDRFLYIVEQSEEAGQASMALSSISIYDMDVSQFILKTGELEAFYTTIAQFKGMLYAYDENAGEIHVLSNTGDLKQKIPFMKSLQCTKMVFTKDGWLIISILHNGRTQISIFDESLKEVQRLNASDLIGDTNRLEGNKEYIDFRDFDVYDGEHLLIKVIPQKLLLYNFKKRTMKGTSYLGDSAGVLCFNQNTLYSTSEARVGVFSNHISNMSYVGSPDTLERMIVNSGFPWSTDPQSLEEWKMEPVELPSNGLNYAHQKMKCRGKFVYILDDFINTLEEGQLSESQILRVAK